MNEVENWIEEGCNFREGVVLLRRITGRSGIFEKYEDFAPGHIRDQLLSELRKYKDTAAAMMSVRLPDPDIAARPTPPGKGSSAEKNDPESVVTLRGLIQTAHKRMQMAHNEMRLSGDSRERYRLAAEIETVIGPKLDHFYEMLKHYKQTGEEPMAFSGEKAATEAGRLRQVLNLRSRICKIKKQLADPLLPDRRRVRLEIELSEKETLLESCEKN